MKYRHQYGATTNGRKKTVQHPLVIETAVAFVCVVWRQRSLVQNAPSEAVGPLDGVYGDGFMVLLKVLSKQR